MKTKKVRPVLVDSDTWQPLVYSTNQYGGLFKSEYYSPMKEMGDTYKQLILISTDPDEKIEIGDLVYLCKMIKKVVNITSEHGHIVCETATYLKEDVSKVITNQLSPEPEKFISVGGHYQISVHWKEWDRNRFPLIPETYIQQFIEEYNADEVKDIEIEMEGIYETKHESNLGEENFEPYIIESRTKLTNGFIAIVEQKEGVTFSLNEKEKQEVLEYYCSLK